MNQTQQQKSTLGYFRREAKRWSEKARAVSSDRVNVVEQRNHYVLRVIGQRKVTERTLDVGCGSGELVCEEARRNIRATGIDFSPEMIGFARERATQENLALTEFVLGSIFDLEMERGAYDVISANGFIEYISLSQLRRFLKISFESLRKGGSFIVGSRNRLFNLFSLNAFTQEEMNRRSISALLAESMALVDGRPLELLFKLKPAPFQKGMKQSKTGIDVSVRYQYTPLQLMALLRERGLKIRDVFPIHIHAVIPRFKERHPSLHVQTSNTLHKYAERDGRLVIPFSSSFMIHAERP